MVAEVVHGLEDVWDDAVEHVNGRRREGDGRPHDRSRLTGGSSDADDQPREDSGKGRGYHHLLDRLPPGGAQSHATLPKRVWNALERLLACENYGGQVHQAQDYGPRQKR